MRPEFSSIMEQMKTGPPVHADLPCGQQIWQYKEPLVFCWQTNATNNAHVYVPENLYRDASSTKRSVHTALV